MAKLRMMWAEIYRLRRVHKHCYEYAQLAVLVRLRTWAVAKWQSEFDICTLYSDRPDPVLAKVLVAPPIGRWNRSYATKNFRSS